LAGALGEGTESEANGCPQGELGSERTDHEMPQRRVWEGGRDLVEAWDEDVDSGGDRDECPCGNQGGIPRVEASRAEDDRAHHRQDRDQYQPEVDLGAMVEGGGLADRRRVGPVFQEPDQEDGYERAGCAGQRCDPGADASDPAVCEREAPRSSPGSGSWFPSRSGSKMGTASPAGVHAVRQFDAGLAAAAQQLQRCLVFPTWCSQRDLGKAGREDPVTGSRLSHDFDVWLQSEEQRQRSEHHRFVFSQENADHVEPRPVLE
jgi:hypothetical protein